MNKAQQLQSSVSWVHVIILKQKANPKLGMSPYHFVWMLLGEFLTHIFLGPENIFIFKN